MYGDTLLEYAIAADKAAEKYDIDVLFIPSIIGRSQTIVINDGKMDLGDFGFIYFIDFDKTRARTRTAQIMIIGE